jgi:cytochrome bd-type quinol oxidase subunit 2
MSGAQNTETTETATAGGRGTGSGVGRVLVAVYAILAIAATGRSVFQIIDRFSEAPVAFVLSALSGVIYIVATIALGARLRRLAIITISIELIGVLVVGTLSLVAPSVLGLDSIDPFGRESTVWSAYGAGYLLVPLVLPVLGLLYLRRRGTARSAKA